MPLHHFLRFGLWLTVVCSSQAFAKAYVGAAVGATHFHEREQISSSLELTGGLAVLPNFSVEASYLDLGDTVPDGGDYIINVSGLGVAGRATMPLGSRVDLFAKMGLYAWESKEEHGDDSTYLLQGGQDVTYGGGVAWRTSRHFDVSLEYKELSLTAAPNQQVSLGVRFAF